MSRVAAAPAHLSGDVPRLGGEIHLWHVDLDRSASTIPLGICSAEERSRARQFAAQRDGDRFLALRAALRVFLGNYTGEAPERLRLATGEFGKPFLETGGIYFNVSHCQASGIVAIRGEGEVGIDLQHLIPGVDVLAIARTAFAREEIAALEKLTGSARLRLFFRFWACREAALKAVGLGFAGNVVAGSDLRLEADPKGNLRIATQSLSPRPLRLVEFSPAPGVFGAAAWPANGSPTSVRHFSASAVEPFREILI